MARKRVKVAAGSVLSRAQLEELTQTIRVAMEAGGQIPWRKMLESAAFSDLTYDLLRREGKVIMRQLARQQNGARAGPIKRQVSGIDEVIAEPEPVDERVDALKELVAPKDERVTDRGEQMKAQAVTAEKDELVAEEQPQKQADSLQQCISELSAIIASKDVQLAEANARYEALKEGIRQLASFK